MLAKCRVPLVAAALLAAQACAPAAQPGRAAAPPRLLVASPESRVGGEAYYEGTLQTDNGCVVVVVSQGRTALPIFDSSVRLTDTNDGLVDVATRRRLSFGARFSAAGAWLRDNGRGWPFSDIEQFVGPSVPVGCGGDSIVRLKRFGPVRLEQ